MAGLSVDEGREYFAGLLYKGNTQETLVLGLFTAPTAPTVATTWADITQPSGAGYAEITLVEATWTVSSLGVATYPQQTWTATADWSPGDVVGYYIRNNNATKVLIHTENGPNVFPVYDGNVYTVDLSIDTA